MDLDFDPKKNISRVDYLFASLNITNKVNDLLTIRKIVKNWYDVLFFRLGMKKELVTKLRSGEVKHFKNQKEYFDFWNTKEAQEKLNKASRTKDLIKIKNGYVEFKWDSRNIKIHYQSSKQLMDMLALIREQFFNEQYKWLNVKGKVVVDIGANVGDTAIYFALRGANHVYAFEPYPFAYETAVKNIKINGLEDKVTILNEGCAGKIGKITITPKYQNVGGTDLKNFDKGKKINITTLGKLVERFGIKRAILKIDCEGCEYGVILNSNQEKLKRFDQIMIEYHYGYMNLVSKLKENFEVQEKRPRYSFNKEASNHDMYVGILYCMKKT